MIAGRLHAVILAGGSGTRFWPLSREKMPKQLLSIVGEESMLALTLNRIGLLVAEEDIFIVTTRSQAAEVHRELQNIGRTSVAVIEEPAGRNTAAAIGLAAVHVAQKDPQAVMAVFPADHHIKDSARFASLLQEARQVALQDRLVTLGIMPTSPETGYGYIQRGSALEESRAGGATPPHFAGVRTPRDPRAREPRGPGT